MPAERVFITGGQGMLAQAIQQALRDRQIEFISPARDLCDITRSDDLARQIDLVEPTVVINCAAFTKVDVCEKTPELANEVNGHAVGRLGSVCATRGIRVVHFSTDYVFDGKSNRPYQPGDVTQPINAYGASKRFGEQLLLETHGDGSLIVRTSWLFGAGGPSFPRTILTRARAEQPLQVVNDQHGCPTYTADLAAATLQLIDRGARGIHHFCNSEPTTWFNFAREVLRVFEVAGEIDAISSAAWAERYPATATRPAYGVLAVELPARPWRETLPDFRRAIESETN